MRIFNRIISKVYIIGITIRRSRKEPVLWQAGVNYNNKGSRAVIGSCCIGENVPAIYRKMPINGGGG